MPHPHASRFWLIAPLLAAVGGLAACSSAASGADAPVVIVDQKPGPVKALDLPDMTLRLRVLSVKGKPPTDSKKFQYYFYKNIASGSSVADQWGDEIRVENLTYTAALGPHSYPNCYIKGFPVVLKLSVEGVTDLSRVEAEVSFDGKRGSFTLSGELFGPTWGMLLWLDTKGEPHLETMAQYNRRYWAQIKGRELAPADRPKLFPIVDRLIPGDNDNLALVEGTQGLAAAGFSALMVNADARSREAALATGNTRTAGAIYSPPGYAFDHEGAAAEPDAVAEWAKKQAEPYLKAGYSGRDVAVYALSDEPGWYYPAVFEPLQKSPKAMARFREFLKSQGLTPAELGQSDWAGVNPLARSKAVDLPSKRLFYWTARFFSWDSARHFAVATRALEQAFHPGMPIFTNWNFFAGRSYVPGPVANNSAKTSPDAGMGGHDWFEFARMRGGTMLWTEDWFGDSRAYQWSFYSAKLESAARKGHIEFGGYVIPRTSGQRPLGLEQKILTIVGMGGKGIKYFVFGPEYNFPGNCYSAHAELLPRLAEAHRMIGKAEPLLWPGRPAAPKTAILFPRSAQMWDARDIEVPKVIDDATNTNLNGKTVDYMAEVYNLYLALQHQNIAASFVEEEDLTPEGLKDYKVLYLTTPNVPAEFQKSLLDWVKRGGTLVTVPGAVMADRYDEPCDELAKGLGIHRSAVARLRITNTATLPVAAQAEFAGKSGESLPIFGNVDGATGTVFAGDSISPAPLMIGDKPAVISAKVGEGLAVHFAFFPGLTYFRTGKAPAANDFPEGFNLALARMIAAPARVAGVEPRAAVSQPLVETPVLFSDAGAAVTLLNWNNKPIEKLTLTLKPGFEPASVESVKRGKVEFEKLADGSVRVTVPLDATDILMLRRK